MCFCSSVTGLSPCVSLVMCNEIDFSRWLMVVSFMKYVGSGDDVQSVAADTVDNISRHFAQGVEASDDDAGPNATLYLVVKTKPIVFLVWHQYTVRVIAATATAIKIAHTASS